jgi:two-component system response regulator RegX3
MSGDKRFDCLVVDDERALSEATVEYFTMFGLRAAWVENAQAAEAFLAGHEVDLVLLDVNLEGESGFAFCRRLRRSTDVPILFISARGGDDDVLLGLGVGGDDYIAKPYSLSVLLAKVQAVLRRRGDRAAGDGEPDRMAFGPYTVRFDLERVFGPEGEVALTVLEYRLLACLIGAAGRAVGKRELFNAVWGHAGVTEGALNVQIRRLRAKLGDTDPPRWIKTVWGVGYRFDAADGEPQ